MNNEENKTMDHLYALLFTESNLDLSNYENYLRDKLTSKQLAEKMTSLREVIKKIEDLK